MESFSAKDFGKLPPPYWVWNIGKVYTVSAVGKGSYLRFLNTGMTKSDLIVGKTILLVVRTTSLL